MEGTESYQMVLLVMLVPLLTKSKKNYGGYEMPNFPNDPFAYLIVLVGTAILFYLIGNYPRWKN